VDDLTILLAVVTALMGWVGFSITAILRGWMIPRATHEREVGILERRLKEVTEEKDEWREASRASEAVTLETRAQHRMLLEQTQTTAYVLEQMKMAAQQARSERPGSTYD
jgi:hypothetical protein